MTERECFDSTPWEKQIETVLGRCMCDFPAERIVCINCQCGDEVGKLFRDIDRLKAVIRKVHRGLKHDLGKYKVGDPLLKMAMTIAMDDLGDEIAWWEDKP